MDQLLERPFDAQLFDRIVDAFYTGSDDTRTKAQQVLTAFGNQPDAWQSVATILDASTSANAKYLGLRILEQFVLVRWYTVPVSTRLEIRNYLVQQVIRHASAGTAAPLVLGKLNVLLVQILKKDWLHHWPEFIPELVAASPTSLALCENNLRLIAMFCQDVFEKEDVIVAKQRKMRARMMDQAPMLLDLCTQVLTSPTVPPSLSRTALATVAKLVPFIDTSAVPTILKHIALWGTKSHAHRHLVVECHAEIIARDELPPAIIPDMANSVLSLLSQAIGPSLDDMDAEDQACVQQGALFLTSVMTKPLEMPVDLKTQCHRAMLAVSGLESEPLWVVCLEYWEKMVTSDAISGDFANDLLRTILAHLDQVDQVDPMASKVLRWAVQANPAWTLGFLEHELQAGLQAQLWDDQVPRVCWAIASLDDDDVRAPPQPWMGPLVDACMRAFQASLSEATAQHILQWASIILGHAPRHIDTHLAFVAALWPFLRDALHSNDPEIKKVACNSLAHLAKAPAMATLDLPGNGGSLLARVGAQLPTILSDWHQTREMEILFASLGCMIRHLAPGQQLAALQQVMAVPNEKMGLVARASSMNDLVMLRTVMHINVSLGTHIGAVFQHQFDAMLPLLLVIYSTISSSSAASASLPPPQARMHVLIKQDCCKILSAYATHYTGVSLANVDIWPQLLWTIMLDFHDQGFASAAPVLTMMAELIKKLKLPWAYPQNAMVTMLIEPTLMAIKQNMSDYPDHRSGFFTLLQAIGEHYFQEMMQWPVQDVALLLDSMLWGARHTLLDIALPSLKTCLTLLQQVRELDDEDMAGDFYQAHYMRLLDGVLQVLKDPDCQNSLHAQSRLLATLLQVVEQGEVYVPVFDPSQVANPLMSNTVYITQYVHDFFMRSFPFLASHQVEVMVRGMFAYSDQMSQFEQDLQDFLVDIRQAEDDEVTQEIKQDELLAEQELFTL
ncbi:CRM1 C terminal-domain-containing protein [Gongronella butleri]|nr:CRM1 C terminal-domain-containing protein [Gongronella butleri]